MIEVWIKPIQIKWPVKQANNYKNSINISYYMVVGPTTMQTSK